jgi:hypothetical protein
MAREIDDVYKRKKYKEQQYGDKKSRIDDYTGERVFMGNERDAKYKHPTNKTSDTDHITPIGVVEERYKWLSKEQKQTLVNNEKHNYATTNSKLNRSKGDLENREYLIRQIKKGEPENLKTSATMLANEVDSRVHMDAEATTMYAKNVSDIIAPKATEIANQTINMAKSASGSFVTGATDTLVKSVIPLTAEAVRKLCKVANGEESLGDAAEEMGKVVVDVAVAGGTNKLLLDVVNSQLRNSKNAVFSKLANSNEVAQIITVAVIVKESAVKYINGEIDGKEFIEEVGVKGASMVAGMIGGSIGGEIGVILGGIAGTVALPGVGTAAGVVTGKVIGEILGTIITTVACSSIVSVYNTSKHLTDYKLKENQIKKLEAEALNEMENQRNKFRSIVEREYKWWDEEIKDGFNMILSSACEQNFNLQGVTDGLDKILALFGKSVAFKNLDEYEGQLDMTLKLSF